MEISNRLQALINLVPIVKTVVDIGCDHGYVPIALIQLGKVEHAIAMDVNMGPLKRAKKNIFEKGYQSQIETRLSNGFDQLQIGEADCAILAGMGGRLIQAILKKEIEKTKEINTLILQPQSEIADVREFILETGYVFVNEIIIYEDNKYYFLMHLTKKEEAKLKYNEIELRFGKQLLERNDPILLQFILQKQGEYYKIIQSLEKGKRATSNKTERMKEINLELKYIEHALEYYNRES